MPAEKQPTLNTMQDDKQPTNSNKPDGEGHCALATGSAGSAGRWDRPGQMKLKENGEIGDCWRCCIAAILRVDPQDVPHFVEASRDDPMRNTARWLRERGFLLIDAKNIRTPEWDCPEAEEVPVIACGPTMRSKAMGEHHAVILVQGELVYDPHPSRAGLTAICREYAVVRPALPNKTGEPRP